MNLADVSKLSPAMQRAALADQARASAARERVMAQIKSKDVQRLAHNLHEPSPFMSLLTPPAKSPAKALSVPARGRLRQNSTGLNKTEQAFLEFLRRGNPHRVHLSQSITLKIANGCRYTPDFITVCDCAGDTEMPNDPQVSQLRAYETKGFMRDDAAVKIKVAASLYPWIKFHLVTKKKREWIIQEILP